MLLEFPEDHLQRSRNLERRIWQPWLPASSMTSFLARLQLI